MIRELHELYRWGALHEMYTMTVPDLYIGHADFCDMGLIKEFYTLSTSENAEKWVREDIIERYGTDYRIHLVRIDSSCAKTKGQDASLVQDACIRHNIGFVRHTSTERIEDKDLEDMFSRPLDRHVVVAIMHFFRRANLIPNQWKIRIGAVHEKFSKNPDNSVQIQGLVGRMTGYWRNIIESGHKTGPFRTSMRAIAEYEAAYSNPFDVDSYQSAGFKIKKKRIVKSKPTMLHVHNIPGLEDLIQPRVGSIERARCPIVVLDVSDANIEEMRINIQNSANIMNILRRLAPDVYDMYKGFDRHCMKMDTDAKRSKWRCATMQKPDAMSSDTNVPLAKKDKNVLVVYVDPDLNKVFLNPWRGGL